MTAALVALLLAKLTVTTAIGLAVSHLARKSRAAVRHVVLAATFGVAIALPLASTVVPSIGIPVSIAAPQGAPRPAAPLAIEGDAVLPTIPGAPANISGPAVPSVSLSLSSVLFAVWALGTALCLIPIAVGLWQMRSLRRSGVPCPHAQAIVDTMALDNGIRRRAGVYLHESTPGPLTFGVVRPAIVLPADADTWNEDDLRRAVIHELEHVRRGDWMTQCLARAACATYWFHPLLWIAWRRLVLEAERACDDAVLRRSEATDYADQLVGLAKRLSLASRQPLLAMANRADLSTRVVAVLDGRQRRGRAGAAWVAAACALSMLIVIAVSPLRLIASTPQAAQATAASGARLRYDVATIKPCEPEERPSGARGTYGGTNASFSPGRFSVPCVTTGQLIYLAYAAAGVGVSERLVNDDPGTAASPQKVRGGPDWVHSLRDKYHVEATAAGATERTILMGAMLQTLLEERFQLKLHRETEEVAMYELTVAKSGLKVKPMKDGDCAQNDGSPIDLAAAKPRCGNLSMLTTNGHTRWVFGGFTLESLAASISRALGAHVIDRTNIKDQFIMRLEFQREGQAAGDDVLADRSGREVRAGDAPPIPTALEEQLGLKLEKTKGPRGYLVIDHIERPTPDAPASTPPARAAGPGRRR